MAKIEWLIDKCIGSFLCFVLGINNRILPSKNKKIKKLNNIAVIKLWALGESVLTLPMIKSIKHKYPDSNITILARDKNAHVFQNLPFINRIILIEPRNALKFLKMFSKFDLSIDCEPYLKLSGLLSWFCAKKRIGFSHTVRYWLYTHPVDFNDKQHEVLTYMDMAKQLGIYHAPKSLVKLSYSSNDKTKVNSILEKAKIKKKDKIIGLCAGTAESAKHRSWSAENFAKLADKLAKKKNAKIIFVGSPNEHKRIEKIRSIMNSSSINLAGKTSKTALFYLVKKCKLFISNDTGPMHVAAAQGTKTIGLFGPNLSVRFAPFGKKNVSLEKPLRCRPCINVHKGQLPSKCKNNKNCINLISVGEVYKEAEKLI
ncbi:glycosyltransferase family 9 protein [Candidatus Woesearchaeota archaeon]|nr:glycosyltransferase family 9 protein [Candidatus Woesearchaeota archaeon]